MTPLNKLPAGVSQVMQLVILALLPGVLVFVYQTGWGGLLNIGIAIIAAVVFEAMALWLRQRDALSALSDYSAIVTGLLIALCLPPLLPWWIPVIAVAFAILLAKHCYGGLGQNIFNPAMAGYAVVLISFPRDLSLWLSLPDAFGLPLRDALYISLQGGLVEHTNWNALTGATALDRVRDLTIQGATADEVKNATHGLFGAIHSEWLNAAYLAGGLTLMITRVINWHIPAGILAGILFSTALQSILTAEPATTASFHLFGGATMLCAFFIATDPVSAASGNLGRIIYAVGIGVLIFVIRTFGSYPDSIAFAVLLMNCTVPVIDRVEPYLRIRSS